MRHFLWRVIRNALATKEFFFFSKSARSPVCGICRVEVESIEHDLFRRNWTKKVWDNCGIIFPEPNEKMTSVRVWLLNLQPAFGNDFSVKLGMIAQICWASYLKDKERLVLFQYVPASGKGNLAKLWGGSWRVLGSSLF